MKAKYKNLEIDYTAKIPIIQEQILKIKERAIQRENRADYILKNNNCLYLKCWNLEQDKILTTLNNVIIHIMPIIIYFFFLNPQFGSMT